MTVSDPAHLREHLEAIADPEARAAQAQAFVAGAEVAQQTAAPVLRRAVLELRAAGWSHREVARLLGVTKGRAQEIAREGYALYGRDLIAS